MVTYRTRNGTITVSKVKGFFPIKEIKSEREFIKWHELKAESYFIEIRTNKSRIKREGKKIPNISLTNRYTFFDSSAIDEYNAFVDVKKSVEIAIESAYYPKILLKIINEAIDAYNKK